MHYGVRSMFACVFGWFCGSTDIVLNSAKWPFVSKFYWRTWLKTHHNAEKTCAWHPVHGIQIILNKSCWNINAVQTKQKNQETQRFWPSWCSGILSMCVRSCNVPCTQDSDGRNTFARYWVSTRSAALSGNDDDGQAWVRVSTTRCVVMASKRTL